MPAWKGAGLSDSDIWALAHYVKSLLDIKGTKDARQLREAIASQGPFQVPAKVEEPKPAEGEEGAAEGEKGDEKGEEKKDEKKGEEKKDEKKGEEKKGATKQPAQSPGARPQPSPPITPKPGGGDDTY
jgi:hypothetical protein